VFCPRAAMAKSFAYVSEEANGTVQVIDLESYAIVQQIDLVGNGCFEFSTVDPSGRRVYVSDPCSGSDVFAIDTSTNTIVPPTIIAGDNPIGMGVLPDGSRLYVG